MTERHEFIALGPGGHELSAVFRAIINERVRVDMLPAVRGHGQEAATFIVPPKIDPEDPDSQFRCEVCARSTELVGEQEHIFSARISFPKHPHAEGICMIYTCDDCAARELA